jgi:hypothetical protein
MLRTFWNQDQYYNSLCPYDHSQQTYTLTGCVATAMAQLMKFWKWPDTATGQNSYIPYSNPGYGTQSANFSQAVYQWDSMKLNLSAPNSWVAGLMHDAGVSVDMDYGVQESGAYVNKYESSVCAQNALVGNFRYQSTLTAIIRSSYTDSGWVTALQNELFAGRPVIYEGYGNQGGHCFLTDGFYDYDMFHFNWGWGGAENGYFLTAALDPGYDTFNNGQAALINIIPDTPVTTIASTGLQTVNNTNSHISIYPNPAKDVINISTGNETISEIYVTDMQGRRLISNYPANAAQSISLPVGDLAPGVYIIQLNTDKGPQNTQIVIAR